jgi:hypothetical protein
VELVVGVKSLIGASGGVRIGGAQAVLEGVEDDG